MNSVSILSAITLLMLLAPIKIDYRGAVNIVNSFVFIRDCVLLTFDTCIQHYYHRASATLKMIRVDKAGRSSSL